MEIDITVYIPKTEETIMFLDYLKNTLKWTTAEGRKITPKDMEKRHIINCMAILNRGGGRIINVKSNEMRKNWIKIFTHELFIREFTS